jgi:hypothetical protein
MVVDGHKVHRTFSKTATIYSNDPEHPRLVITIRGEIIPYVEVLPTKSVFIAGVVGESIHQQLRLKANVGEKFEILGVSSNLDDKITYRVSPTPDPREFVLDIWSNPKLQPIQSTGRIAVKTNLEEKPVVYVAVDLRVRGSIVVRPVLLNFGLIPVKENMPDHVVRELEVVRTSKPFRILEVDFSDPHYKAEVEEVEPGHRYKVVVRLEPEKKVARYDGAMTLHFDDPIEKSQRVRLMGRTVASRK